MKKVAHSSLESETISVAANGSHALHTPDPSEKKRLYRPLQRIGNYRIIKPIGRGSMGEVFLCEHVEVPQMRVAIKVFNPAARHLAPLTQRFKNEISTAASISHPHVIRPFEVFHTPEVLAYSMEYMSNGSLSDWMRSHPTITLEQGIKVLSQICDGVQAIHDRGFIHRDIKPENILLDHREHVRITDLALSRPSTQQKASERGGIVGTIEYLSPQYLEHGTTGPLCDVYAIGAIAFELFTKKTPFNAVGMFDMIMEKIASHPAAADEVNPRVPRPLALLISQALSRDESHRFPSPQDFGTALKNLLTCSPQLKDLEIFEDTKRPTSASTQPPLSLVKGGKSVCIEGSVVTFTPAPLTRVPNGLNVTTQRREASSYTDTLRAMSLSSVIIVGLTVATAAIGCCAWVLFR